MNLIKTSIVDPNYDIFWNDISPAIAGHSERPVLILVSAYKTESAEAAQLQKMLDACKLTAEQCNIIMLEDDRQLAWHQLREKLDPEIIFLIGILPARLGVSVLFSLNEPNRFDERTWLPTLSLEQLEKHPEVKKQLWISGMKPVFIENFPKA